MKLDVQPSRYIDWRNLVALGCLIVALPGCAADDPAPAGPTAPRGRPPAVAPVRPAGTGTSTDAAIHHTAIQRVDRLDSSTAPGTGGGNYACAWAVNKITKEATGYEVGGGLSTADMYDRLAAGRGTNTAVNAAPEGSVIISPTEWIGGVRKTGHVGILGTGSGSGRLIYSNSSGATNWKQNFTAGRWANYYSGRGLKVKAYQIHEKP